MNKTGKSRNKDLLVGMLSHKVF